MEVLARSSTDASQDPDAISGVRDEYLRLIFDSFFSKDAAEEDTDLLT